MKSGRLEKWMLGTSSGTRPYPRFASELHLFKPDLYSTPEYAKNNINPISATAGKSLDLCSG